MKDLTVKQIEGLKKKQISELVQMKKQAQKMGKSNAVEMLDDLIAQTELTFDAFVTYAQANPITRQWPFTANYVPARGGR